MPDVKIAASILNADFGHLAEQVRQVEAAGVEYIHVDVMDGHFVPNITLGFAVVEAIRRATSLPLDVHLMIDQPERYLERFAQAGADLVTVHREAVDDPRQALDQLRALGIKAGVAVSPPTSLDEVAPVVDDLDLLLVMTIQPGFGGQPLIPAMIDKVWAARALLDERGSAATLEVDGGVKVHNVAELALAGADLMVVGTGIFHADGGISAGVAALRTALGGIEPR
jgi:ribulose-phosphate 3-epimerase